MKLETRSLRSSSERAFFCARYTEASGTSMSPEQLRGCELIGVFSQGRLCGGFGLRVQGPYRAFAAIRRPWDSEAFVSHRLVEATALWSEPWLRRTSFRLFITLSMFLRARSLGGRRLLGITTKPALWESTYRPLGSRVLYLGEVELEAGRPREGLVFEMNLFRAFLRLPYYLLRKKKKGVPQCPPRPQTPTLTLVSLSPSGSPVSASASPSSGTSSSVAALSSKGS